MIRTALKASNIALLCTGKCSRVYAVDESFNGSTSVVLLIITRKKITEKFT